MKRKKLAGTVIALGLVSFFTDMSSEMIYPLLPVFLATVLGAGALSLGVIEGVAESTAALLKVFSGIVADRVRRRKPLILMGYGLAGVVRPLIGLAAAWPFVLAMRFMDRIGKGLRTSPRDALIADVTAPEMRGRAFGFHRSMDHAGAVAGPLLAVGLLALPGVGLRQVFLLAAIPAAVVMAVLVFGVREPAPAVPAAPGKEPFGWHWAELGSEFKMVLGALLVFTLGNSTDAFLLLRMRDAFTALRLDEKEAAAAVAGLWALHHVVKMVCTYAGGILSDRFGRRRLVLAGWVVYAAVYAGFALARSPYLMIGIFLAYGLYFGLTEPVEKAWVADMAPVRLRGAAFGYYHGVIGVGALPASLLFGLLWQAWGVAAAFLTGAGLALAAAGILWRWVPLDPGREGSSAAQS